MSAASDESAPPQSRSLVFARTVEALARGARAHDLNVPGFRVARSVDPDEPYHLRRWENGATVCINRDEDWTYQAIRGVLEFNDLAVGSVEWNANRIRLERAVAHLWHPVGSPE